MTINTKRWTLTRFVLLLLTVMHGGCSVLSVSDGGLGTKDWRWDDNSLRWLWAHASYRREPQVADDSWIYQKAALQVRVEAPQTLNTHNNQAHTVVVKLFQLSDPSGFNKLIKTPSGIRSLLTDESVDESILFSNTFTVSPNASRNLSLDRQEGARYLGIVSGYVDMKANRNTRLIPFVGIDDNQSTGFFASIWNFFSGTEQEEESLPVRPATINMELWLGSESIEKIVSHAI